MEPNAKQATMGRRDFLKASALVGSSVAISTLFGNDVPKAEAKTYDTIYDMIKIDQDKFKRVEGKDLAFARRLVPKGLLPADDRDDPELMAQLSGENTETPFKPGDPGYTQLDYAFCRGSEACQMLTGSAPTMAGFAEGSTVNFELEDGTLAPISLFGQTSESYPAGGPDCFEVAKEKWEFDSPKDAAYAIKKAAKVYGADLVGIAPYDENFIYKSQIYMPKNLKGELIKEKVNLTQPIDFGFEPKSVIVLAWEMDYECMKAQATQIEMAATTMGYARMSEDSFSLARFIRALGYNTYHCGNNVSPSVGEAIRAGLGEGGRLCMLITEEFGPRIRLAKVYTDLEFEYDKPKSFGVTEFCEVCQLCSEACPTEAITKLSIDDPENKPVNQCSQEGVRKYYTNAQRCLLGWYKDIGGNDCGICISVCPYNKPQAWNHDVVKIVTRVPGLNRFAKYFDEFFGYGGIRDGQTISDFWKRTI